MLTIPGDRCVVCGNCRIKDSDASFHVLCVGNMLLHLKVGTHLHNSLPACGLPTMAKVAGPSVCV